MFATSLLGLNTIQPDFTLSWNADDDDGGGLSGFSCKLAHLIWERLPLDSVTSINSNIITDKSCYVRLWFDVLQSTPLLESLFIDPASASSFCIFLDPASDFIKVVSMIPHDYPKQPPYIRHMIPSTTEKAVRKAHTRLNNLHTLVIDGSDFVAMQMIDGALASALRHRDDASLPRLSLLSFKDCKVGVADLTELQSLVERVVCDADCLAETDGEIREEDSEDDEV